MPTLRICFVTGRGLGAGTIRATQLGFPYTHVGVPGGWLGARLAPDEAPCTRLLPWSRSLAVGVGDHRQPYCVEIPRTVGPHDAIRLIVVAKYRGVGGLWTLRVPFPPVSDPGR